VNRKIVYIVTSRSRSRINEREKRLCELGGEQLEIVLICRGENHYSGNVWEVEPDPNPTGVLRELGMISLKRTMDRWLYFPSPSVLYVNAVYRRLRKQIRGDLEDGLEITLITCLPAHDLCLLGIRIKGEFPRVRWVCDWQDLWSYDDYYLERVPALYRNKVRRLEKLSLDCCDMNITTNPKARQLFIEEFGVSLNKCRSIYHPYMDKLNRRMSKESPNRPEGEVKMVFLGTLFKPPKMPGDRLLRALMQVRRKGIDVRMDVYGSPLPNGLPLEESGTTYRGYLCHEDIVSTLQEYDILVLIMADLPNSKVVMNIKLPSYFVTGKPICAIVPEDSAVAEMVRQTGTGYVISSSKDWGKGLYEMLLKYQSGDPLPNRNEEEIARFGWHALSKEWRKVI